MMIAKRPPGEIQRCRPDRHSIRVTIGKRSLQNGQVEIKLRRENTHTSIASSAAVEEILRLKSMLEEEIARSTAEVPFK